jgi:hypothetical protein
MDTESLFNKAQLHLDILYQNSPSLKHPDLLQLKMESLLLLNIKHKELVSSNNSLILIKNLKLEDKNY